MERAGLEPATPSLQVLLRSGREECSWGRGGEDHCHRRGLDRREAVESADPLVRHTLVYMHGWHPTSSRSGTVRVGSPPVTPRCLVDQKEAAWPTTSPSLRSRSRGGAPGRA